MSTTLTDVRAYTDMLNSIYNPEPPQQLNESFDVEDDGSLWVVTEGWDDGDMQSLCEAEDYDFLSESIFGGAPKHIINNIVKTGVKRGGEDSPVHKTVATRKGHVYIHLQDAEAGSGEKNEQSHTIVRHNGKVIASIHPQTTNKNTKYSTQTHNPDEGQDLKSKGHAYDHIYNAIEKAGGYKGHHVEIHSIKTDHMRTSKEESRAAGGHTTPENQSKSFKSIAKRAAEKITDKHSNIEDASKKHESKIKAATTRFQKHLAKPGAASDIASIMKHTNKLKELEDAHPKHHADTINAKKKQAGAGLAVHAMIKGIDKDRGNLNPDTSRSMNKEIAKHIRKLKQSPEDSVKEDKDKKEANDRVMRADYSQSQRPGRND